MDKRLQRVMLIIGAILLVFGFFFSLSGAVSRSYPLLIGSGISVIIGLIIVAYVWD